MSRSSVAALSAFSLPSADRDDHIDRLERLIPFATVRERTGLSRSTIWRLVRVGAFPPSIRISPGRCAWHEAAVDRWIASKLAAARQ
jgi:prophage regulatory protein